MNVRNATAADVEGIRRVARRAWETDYPDILTRERTAAVVDEWYATGSIRDELDHPATLLLVADVGGTADVDETADGARTVVGFVHATWKAADAEGYLYRLYVDPDHRREGVGTALLREAAAELVDRGCEQVYAMVLAANDLGNEFYGSLGFERVDEGQTIIGGETYPEYRYVLDAGELPLELSSDG